MERLAATDAEVSAQISADMSRILHARPTATLADWEAQSEWAREVAAEDTEARAAWAELWASARASVASNGAAVEAEQAEALRLSAATTDSPVSSMMDASISSRSSARSASAFLVARHMQALAQSSDGTASDISSKVRIVSPIHCSAFGSALSG